VKRSQPLRADPAKVREWQRRSAARWGRSRRRTGAAAAEYQAVRDARRAHAHGLCEIAGPTCTRWGTEVHHVLPRSKGGADEFGNCLLTCQMCHAHAHNNPAWARERGVLA
jgi:5-methylcytosine-specific restriction endonuclease McrA